MRNKNRPQKFNKLVLLGITAGFLTFFALTLFCANGTWAKDMPNPDYYTNLYSE